MTGQFAAVHGQDVKVYAIDGGGMEVKVAGSFSGGCAWSGNGRYLALANAKGGVTLLANGEMSKDEQKLADEWYKGVKPVASQDFVSAPVAAAASKPIAALTKYAPVNDHAVVSALLTKVLAQKPGDLVTAWDHHPLYAGTPAYTKMLAIIQATASMDDASVRIYRIRELLKDAPDNAMLLYHMADAQIVVHQMEAAEFIPGRHSRRRRQAR